MSGRRSRGSDPGGPSGRPSSLARRVGLLPGGAWFGAAACLVLPACAPTYATAALGSYEQWRPNAQVVGEVMVELDQPGYVSVISIHPQDPSFWTLDHVTFRVSFPLQVEDSTYYPAGRHRVQTANVTYRMPRLCNDMQIPTIDGCRYYREEVASLSRRVRVNSRHYLVIVSAQPLDAYTVAYNLEQAVTFSSTLGEALFRRNAQAAANELADAIADTPGSPLWAGYYVVEK